MDPCQLHAASPKNGLHDRPNYPRTVSQTSAEKKQMKLTDFKTVDYVPSFKKLVSEALSVVPDFGSASPHRPTSGSRLNSNKRKKIESTSCSGRKFYQPVIDANQREIGPRMCPQCGFVGDLDDKEDRKLHSRVHSRFERGGTEGDEILRYTSLKLELVLQHFPTRKIVAIQKGSPANMRKKAVGVLRFVERQLGAVQNCHLSNDGDVVLLAVDLHNKVVDACLCAETISESGCSADFPSSETMPNCGIYFIWVSISRRRQHLATVLVDTLLIHYGRLASLPGSEPLAKCRLAISQPTEDGRRFFESYLGTENLNIYESLLDRSLSICGP